MIGSLGMLLAVCIPAQASVVVDPSTNDPASTLEQYLSIPSGDSTGTSSAATSTPLGAWTQAGPNSVVTVTPGLGSGNWVYAYGAASPYTSTGLIMPSVKDSHNLEKMYIITLGEGADPNKIDNMAFGVGADPTKVDHMAYGVLPKPADLSSAAPSYSITLPPVTTLPLAPQAAPKTPSTVPSK